jgi:hypothetical protein
MKLFITSGCTISDVKERPRDKVSVSHFRANVNW